MKKVIVLASGGVDSTCLLYHLAAREVPAAQKMDMVAISFNYGQRHRRELKSATRVCQELGIRHTVADLSRISHLLAGSSQTSPDVAVPHGHYAEEPMKATVVPNRNMIMLSVAAAWAVSLKFDAVAFAAHAGDHTIYPDCRPEFATAMDRALALCDWSKIRLYAPFVRKTKTDIVRLGAALGVPFGLTYSCYEGRAKHCGRCGTCVERIEAFRLARVPDPTSYEVLP